MKVQKKVFQNIDIVSYALELRVNGVTCVFVVHFRSKNALCGVVLGSFWAPHVFRLDS